MRLHTLLAGAELSRGTLDGRLLRLYAFAAASPREHVDPRGLAFKDCDSISYELAYKTDWKQVAKCAASLVVCGASGAVCALSNIASVGATVACWLGVGGMCTVAGLECWDDYTETYVKSCTCWKITGAQLVTFRYSGVSWSRDSRRRAELAGQALFLSDPIDSGHRLTASTPATVSWQGTRHKPTPWSAQQVPDPWQYYYAGRDKYAAYTRSGKDCPNPWD